MESWFHSQQILKDICNLHGFNVQDDVLLYFFFFVANQSDRLVMRELMGAWVSCAHL